MDKLQIELIAQNDTLSNDLMSMVMGGLASAPSNGSSIDACSIFNCSLICNDCTNCMNCTLCDKCTKCWNCELCSDMVIGV